MRLLEDYRKLHEANAFQGMTLAQFVEPVTKLLAFHGCFSVLDYGSGKGQSWEEMEVLKRYKEKLQVVMYDPGVPALSEKPLGTFDAVLCMDVVEHVPEEDVDATLSDVFGYADKIVIATFCQRGSRKKLPSTGQDVHITQRPRLWWETHFHIANASKSRPVAWYLFQNL